MTMMMMMPVMTTREVSGSDRSRDNPVQGHKDNMCTRDRDDTIRMRGWGGTLKQSWNFSSD